MKEVPVSVPKAAYRMWLKATEQADEPSKVQARLASLRRMVVTALPSAECYHAELHGVFRLVPLTSSVWGICQDDKRGIKAEKGGVVLRTVIADAAVENKLSRMQWTKVEDL
jgi:hypothetical protein